MKIHVAHLDPYNGGQSMIHASTEEALLDMVADFFRDLLPPEPRLATELVLDYVRDHTDSSFYTDVITIVAMHDETVETAQIVWEAMLNIDRKDRSNAAIDHFWNSHGTYAMRRHARALAQEIEDEWQAIPLEEKDGITFDWELVPHLLDKVVWNVAGEYFTLPAGSVDKAVKYLQSRPPHSIR